MDSHPTDRRVRKTKAQLRAALVELLRDRPPSQISVTELTARADVNRGTFYCHYRDIDDMLDHLRDDTLDEFTALMDSYTAAQLQTGLRPILEDIFRFVHRNLDLVTSAMSLDWERSSFLDRLRGALGDKVTRDWGSLYHFTDLTHRERCLSFLVAGVVGLIQSWLEDGCRETPQEMAALAEELILQGIQPLEAR